MYKQIGILGALLTGIFFTSLSSFYASQPEQIQPSPREQKIQEMVLCQMEIFRDYVRDTFLVTVRKKKTNEQELQLVFLKSRLLYKRFEWAAEYFTADLARRLNGPPVQEIENADLLDSSLVYTIDPMGLQMIEPLIFRGSNSVRKADLISELEYLIGNTQYVISWFKDHQLADWRILDAAKLEVFRIISLGITGFDNPLSLNSMEESGAALQSLQEVLSHYVNADEALLIRNLMASVRYLHNHPDFDSFDRAIFITQYANKVSTGISMLEQKLPGRKIRYNRMLRQEAHTLFDADAFNVNAFSPGPEFHMTDTKVQLGKKLFFDISLSGTATRSCASCHNPDLAFTDGLPRNTDLHNPSKMLGRNTPGLLNAALQSNYFYDMRALTLEDQVKEVIRDPHEMGGSMDSIIKHVQGDSIYHVLFGKAFLQKKEITADEVANAFASYIRSLTKLNSRFDRYMRGNEGALSKKELSGFNLFMGKAKCATCHFIPLFSGITPPKYIASETEVLGVPISLADSTLDPDPGYYGVIGVEAYKHAFKTPGIRNIDKTAPYMHNGIYQTLDQVMDFYNNGGAVGLKIHLPNQTLPEENLHLTEEEKADIIAFMKSLDSQ